MFKLGHVTYPNRTPGQTTCTHSSSTSRVTDYHNTVCFCYNVALEMVASVVEMAYVQVSSHKPNPNPMLLTIPSIPHHS